MKNNLIVSFFFIMLMSVIGCHNPQESSFDNEIMGVGSKNENSNVNNSSLTSSSQDNSSLMNWKGRIEKQKMSSFQYVTHIFIGNRFILDSSIKEKKESFVIKSSTIPLDNFIGAEVIVSGRLVEGYPLNIGDPYQIDVIQISADQKIATKLSKKN